LNKKGQLTATASPAQPRRPEILRLATAFYGGGGNFLRLATAYELYGGGSGVYNRLSGGTLAHDGLVVSFSTARRGLDREYRM